MAEKLPFFSRLITDSENPLHSFGEQFFQIEGTNWGRTFRLQDGKARQEQAESQWGRVRNFLRILGTITIIPVAIALAAKLHHRRTGDFWVIQEPQGQAQKAHQAASDIMPPTLTAGRQLNGALGHKFKWPSDHLPIGGSITLDTGTTLRFVSYNALKQEPLEKYINDTSNAQGLNGSAITQLSRSERETLIAEQVIDMIHAGNDVVCLQECSKSLEKIIKNGLPKEFKIGFSGTEGLCIYNENKYHAKESPKRPFSNNNKYIHTLELEVKGTGEKIRISNTHVQQGEVGVLIKSILDSQDHIPTLLIGDMNASPNEFQNKFAGVQHETVSGNKPTHINTKKTLVGYDQVHLITHSGQNPLKATASTQPDDIFNVGSKACSALKGVYKTLYDNLS